jgi:hypothetical protein
MMAGTCAVALSFFANAELHGEVLRLGDVADLSSLPTELARSVRETALLRVDRDVQAAALPREELAAQVGARLPFLGRCFAQTGGPVMVRRKLAPGTPRVGPVDGTGIAKGDEVRVRIVAGPFAIERSGIAAGDAKPGERLFVRTGDGQVVRAVVERALP